VASARVTTSYDSLLAAAQLHRIATNVALRMLEQRHRTTGPVDADLQPYPDRFLDELASPEPSPEARAITSEGVGLAYIAAMQLLPAKQRAVLVLRDGLGWSARDTAELLDDSTTAVNSALPRARERIAREHEEGTLARVHAPAGPDAQAAVMREFLDAWAEVDVPRIVALLSDDALLTMPPMDLRFEGAEAIGEFFATQPAQGRLDRIRHTATRANRQPTLASYVDEHGTGTHDAYGVMVFAIQGDRIAGITGFPHDLETFTRLGLPRCS
jgi:RNA polymerase sigma-70 factor (ECF subfamily)